MNIKLSRHQQWRRNAKNRRQQIITDGGWWLSMLLYPDAAKDLRKLVDAKGLPVVEILSELITEAAAKLPVTDDLSSEPAQPLPGHATASSPHDPHPRRPAEAK
jgi:hypothetical protein